MRKSTSLRQHLLTTLLALAMWTVGQSAWAVYYTPLRGTAGFQNSESYASLVDGQKGTKWCTDQAKADYRDGWYIVFKSSEPMAPSAYQLTTGGDTESYPGRNWKNWTIYGANFDNDDDAVFESEKWTVIDKKEDVGPDQLPAANVKTVTFEMSEVCQEEYEYFMIYVSAVADGGTMQMIEFAFGKTEAIEFTALDGTAGFSDAESFVKLVDGNSNNKWCSNNTLEKYDGGWWITFKASRPFAPYYYMLATSNDTGSNPDRNWVNWSIFGANFASESQCTKNSDAWVLLDLKQNIGPDQLANASWTASFFDLNQYVIEEFEYFKVEIYNSGGDLQQMSELTLGPKEDFPQVANKLYLDLLEFNTDILCQPSLLAEYKALLASMKDAPDMTTVLEIRQKVLAMQGDLTANASAYSALKAQAEIMANFAEKQAGLDAAARKILSDYATQVIAPNDLYPNGSWPYIFENMSLSTADLNAEYEFACAMYEEQSSQIVEDPIEATYEAVAGTFGFSDTESFGSLVDGDEGTKWCANNTHEGYDNGWWIVFKASEPVKPSMYKLVTGNDTGSNPGRNWNNWSIFGGNFDSDEAAEKNAEGWVLLDKKENASGMLPAANFATAFFNMSEVATEPYKYFKVEIYSSGSDLQQMGEIVLGNRGNISTIRDSYYEECAAFDYDVVCQKSLTDRYVELLGKLQTATNMSVIAGYYNELKDLQGSIPSSAEAYAAYVEAVAEVRSVLEVNTELAGFNFDKLMTYLEQTIEANATYPNGSYNYIMETRVPDATEITKEKDYVNMLLEAALNSSYAPLDGTAGFGANEGYAGLVDGSSSTKWCSNTDKDKYDGTWWAIFKTLNPITPAMYTLTTANDTGSNPGRNWKTWSIYGGNFDSNEAATKDAEGWVLIDQKSGIGQDRLGGVSFTDFYFGLSEELTDQYQYFKIVVSELYSGTTMQMAEFLWGTQADFEAIRDQKCDEFDRDLEVMADKALLEAYATALEELGETENIEAMVVAMKKVQDLGAQIDASVSAYETYLAAADEIAVYLEENPALVGDARDLMEEYLNDFVEPGEKFPNGSMFYITEECALNTEQLTAETEFAKGLLRNVVKTCYVAGTDLTSLLSDPNFAPGNALAGWDNTGRWDPANDVEGCYVARNYYNKQETLSQTLTGLKDGIYLVQCNGLFATFENKTSQVYGATFFANGNHVPLQLVIEDPQPQETAVDLENCYITEIGTDPYDNEIDAGYIPTKELGAGYAFHGDRYKNYILAKVTDGTLTLGYQVEGTATTDHDWAVVGNTKLFYCGTVGEASDGIATVLEGMAARATQMLNTEVSTGTDFGYYPSFNKDIRAGLEACITEVNADATNDAKYALVEKFSALFLQQFENVKAYTDLAAALTSLEDIVYNSTDYEFTEEQVNEFKEMYDTAWDNILEGNYTTEEAYAKDMIRKNGIYVLVYGVMPDQKDGIYQITSADEFRWFATQVNGGNTTVSAVLANDIDMATQPNLAPVGTAANPYNGVFDGQGYKISNYRLEATAGRAGLFGTVEGKVGNFTIEGTLKCVGASNGAVAYADGAELWGIHSFLNIDASAGSITHTAGVVGDLDNGSTVTESSFSGTLNAGANNDCFGGVAGYTNTGIITNCVNYGTITFDNVNCYTGGIVAYVNNKTPEVRNCLAVGQMVCTSGTPTYAGVLAGWLRSYTAENYVNNYYLPTAGIRPAGGNVADGLFTAADAETLASGATCYALNQNQNGEVWFQTLGSDATPVLDKTHASVIFQDGKYMNGEPEKVALITSVAQLSSNASDTVEGQNIGALIDGDVNSFWHTDWHNWCTDQYHYLQVELNEPVSGEITAQMTRRNSATNDHPTKMIVWGSTDGETFNEITTIDFAYDGPGSVATADFTLATPVKYLRFGAADCVGEAYGYRTFWHAAEFQLYGVAGTGIEDISSEKIANGIFNLQGQKVEKATKGIYIINGKKVLVK